MKTRMIGLLSTVVVSCAVLGVRAQEFHYQGLAAVKNLPAPTLAAPALVFGQEGLADALEKKLETLYQRIFTLQDRILAVKLDDEEAVSALKEHLKNRLDGLRQKFSGAGVETSGDGELLAWGLTERIKGAEQSWRVGTGSAKLDAALAAYYQHQIDHGPNPDDPEHFRRSTACGLAESLEASLIAAADLHLQIKEKEAQLKRSGLQLSELQSQLADAKAMLNDLLEAVKSLKTRWPRD